MPTDERPNILVIMTEQHRADCLGIAGHPCLLTPTMDSIGYNGAMFSRAYTNCPTCISARRSFLTGQFPATHGMVGYHDGIPWEDPPVTLPQALTESGYQSAWIGRNMHQVPSRRRFGYERIIGHEEYDAFLDREMPYGAGGKFGAGPANNDWTARPWHLEERLHHTQWITEQTLEYLEQRDPSCPFFITMSFYAAHPPLLPPAFYMDRYLRADIPEPIVGDWETLPGPEWQGAGAGGTDVNLTGEALRSCRAGYYGMINHVDDQLRRVLNPYHGMTKMAGNNTIVLFTSDHGEMLGDHYRYHKILALEPSARVPFLLSAPPRFGLQKGLVCDDAVCLPDIMPTLLDLADVEIPDSVEGRSLVPILRGEETSLNRSHIPIEHAPAYQSITDGREKFIWFVADGRELFFDLTNDPDECHNLAGVAEHAERVGQWRQRLIEQLKDRPEGFVADGQLVTGRPYAARLPQIG